VRLRFDFLGHRSLRHVFRQATIWHSLATIRDTIQQTNAIILAACGSDERLCQVAAHRGQIELGDPPFGPKRIGIRARENCGEGIGQ